MGHYAVDKELLSKVQSEIEDLEKSPASHRNKEVYDNLIKRRGILVKRLQTYGVGWVHRIATPHGHFYLVNVEDEDLPELLRDMNIESFLTTKIVSHKFLKLGKQGG